MKPQFNSNVQPKKTIKPQAEDWYCQSCDLNVARYYSKCPSCGGHRPH